MLADGDEPAVALDEPAVAGRIGRGEAQRNQPRALGERRPHRQERGSEEQRDIGVHDQNRPVPEPDRLAGGEHRVGGAPPFALDEHAYIRAPLPRLRRDVLAVRAHNDCNIAFPCLAHRREDMSEHRPGGDLVQHFGAIRPHARAFAGGKDDCE